MMPMQCIICVNDPYTEISTKDDEQTGEGTCPQCLYMKPSDPYPSATAFKTLYFAAAATRDECKS